MLTEPLRLGQTLLMMLDAEGRTQAKVSRDMDCSVTHFNRICLDKVAMTAHYAVRLEYVTGIPADLMMRIQAMHDLWEAQVAFNSLLEQKEAYA